MKFIIEHLSKGFDKKEVLRDINFSFEEGKIYGLLGEETGRARPPYLTALTGISEQTGADFIWRKKAKSGRYRQRI